MCTPVKLTASYGVTTFNADLFSHWYVSQTSRNPDGSPKTFIICAGDDSVSVYESPDRITELIKEAKRSMYTR